MTVKRCPSCAEVMVQETYVINGQPFLFWVCPEGDWEEPVETSSNSEAGIPEEE